MVVGDAFFDGGIRTKSVIDKVGDVIARCWEVDVPEFGDR